MELNFKLSENTSHLTVISLNVTACAKYSYKMLLLTLGLVGLGSI